MDATTFEALKVRAAWMQKMGFSQEEISGLCTDDGLPIDLNEEQENLRCAYELDEITPSAAMLKDMAVKRQNQEP